MGAWDRDCFSPPPLAVPVPLARPLSSLTCKAGRSGHLLSCLLGKEPPSPPPAPRAASGAILQPLHFHSSSKADASILSGPGDVRGMSTGPGQVLIGSQPSPRPLRFPCTPHPFGRYWTKGEGGGWWMVGEREERQHGMLTLKSTPVAVQVSPQPDDKLQPLNTPWGKALISAPLRQE
ncbi:putative ATP-dependent RNA helicase YTHDC2 [Platysternon megacephalum]|uniref:Putative ATP-dependent RNA helicase YTHDC2 n=1 Tax=Platysternon megacephalum TaxID=55544 RepID=A0A4D9EVG9_9SAUR|nr:putative ATP-dependent RNA helicase YTHDC2 [Platysternon megacephalum]